MTTTTNLGLTFPTVGASDGTWGTENNAVITGFDAQFATGSFTPNDGSGAALSFSSAIGFYFKNDKVCWVWIKVTYPSTVSSANAVIGNLPFTSKSLGIVYPIVALPSGGGLAPGIGSVANNGTTVTLIKSTGAALLNSDMSTNTVYLNGAYPL